MYKILIIEDGEIIVQIVKRHLESWGYEVFQIEDFTHVIQEFVQKDPQLVLLDLKLPFFNGFHWCEEIRKISQGRRSAESWKWDDFSGWKACRPDEKLIEDIADTI